jgi:glycosyltransferase involved in cell wall biosynthesis
MLISVIIPAHNEELYISRAIRSAMDQSIGKDLYEIIVIDDGSTDNTLKILKSFGDQIRLIELKDNLGLPYARNAGIRAALGRYIINLDADDFMHIEMLKVQNLFLSMNNDFDAVATDYFIVDEKERHIERRNCEEHPIACGIMFRKERLISIGLYDESFMLCEDQDLSIRFQEKFKIIRIPLPLYRYRQHQNNITKDAKKMKFYKKKVDEKHSKS